MCGIVGLIHDRRKELLNRMNEVQIHRGPDFGGFFWDEQALVGLAMRRLSIVDLANGSQPMTNEDGSIVLVYNGEVYNAQDLRKELLQKGHIFTTVSSDTEVLVHLYEEYKFDMLNRMNGMFAFALYDKKEKIIFIARDQMGIKPLHYFFKNGTFAFASEMKSLLAAGLSDRKINEESLWHYLSLQCVPAPLTIYEDIFALPCASYLIFDLDTSQITIKKYWDCIENRKIFCGKQEELYDYVRSNIIDAIERWTMSDVPLACSLSGGLDSSIIAAVVSKKHALHTYSLGFINEKSYDERTLARKLAEKYGTTHEEILLSPDELLKDMNEMVLSLDAPYAGGLPSWFVFKKVYGNEKVVFNGTGGDELFGNYSKWLRYEHPLVRVQFWRQFRSYGESFSEFLKHRNGSIYHKYMPEQLKRKILEKSEKSWNTSEYIERLFDKCPEQQWKDRIPYVDFKIQLPEEFLMMLDRFSMHFSIEARVPFLDRELVERVMGIPAEYRTRKYDAKYLLKEAMGDLLPQDFLQAEKKGFVLPYYEWLSQNLKEEVLDLCTGSYRCNQGIFGEKLEREIIKPFYEGRRELTSLVWTVFMFQRWYQVQKGNANQSVI